MKKPDFFIVGAPKCGTTALQVYLAQHPDIFMPKEKECHHFADDLIPADDFYRPRGHYLALFAGAQAQQVLGEASVFYLYSRAAARNIYEFNRQAKIIAMFRSPVEMLQSYHAQLLYNTDETLPDLADALAAESARKQGRLIPKNLRFEQLLYYGEIANYSEQLERYLAVFDPRQVHVIIYDDFKADIAKVYREVLQFLGTDPDFQIEFKPVNMHKRPRCRPPVWMRTVWKKYLPYPLRRELVPLIIGLNTKYVPRPPISPDLEARLQAQYAPEVERFGKWLGRDLTHWNRI